MNINQIILAAAIGESMPLNFDTLPTTEAAADSTHFVNVADNTSGGNLTGVGGGLTGANLVFTQVGTVDAASAGWTAISANKGFTLTDTFIDTFLRNSTGFAFLWHCRNATVAAGKYITMLEGTSPANWRVYLAGVGLLACGMDAKFGSALSVYTSAATDVFPSSGEFWVLSSVDYANELAFTGVALGSTQPSKLTDFAVHAVSSASQAPPASAVSCTSGLNYVLGHNTVGMSFGFASFTAKLGPSVSLA